MSLIDVYPIESIPTEPWRNGGGTTRTIATGVSHWRVSLASIERDGPYSRFPGMSRVSLILSGRGVVLRNNEAVVPLRPMLVTEYDGDADWGATLVDGPSVALNAITAKRRYRANVRLVDEPIAIAPGSPAIVVALGGGCGFAEGPDANRSELLPGNVLVSEHHARTLRLFPRAACAGETGTASLVALVTIQPILAPDFTET
ncbi:HutD family protein [Burkholderia sp. Ac-20353]|nr:HutD family protein [Burkholderia sp. Ac-20353]